jgi:hypothetical protein
MAQQNRDFLSDLGNAARDNPASAALIGMGILWLVTGGSKRSLFSGANSISAGVGLSAKAAAQAAAESAGHLGSATARAVDAAGEVISDVTSRVQDATQTATAATGRALTEVGGQVSDTISSASQGVTKFVGDIGKSPIGGPVSEARVTGAKWGNDVQRTLADAFERQPLLLGALGIAIGAGIAAALPETEIENKLAGEASDAVKEQAREMLSSTADQVKTATSRALDDAKARGLTPEAAGDAMHATAEKLSKVANVARQSVTEKIASR